MDLLLLCLNVHDTNNEDKIIVESRWHNCTQLQHILCKWLWLFMGFLFLFAKINISIQLKSLICLKWQYESSTNISFIIECTKLLTIVTRTHSMEYGLKWTFNPFISGGLFSTPLRYGMYQMHSILCSSLDCKCQSAAGIFYAAATR